MADKLKASWKLICEAPVVDDVEPLDQFADTFYNNLWTTTPGKYSFFSFLTIFE